jgi:hypothetical protein
LQDQIGHLLDENQALKQLVDPCSEDCYSVQDVLEKEKSREQGIPWLPWPEEN